MPEFTSGNYSPSNLVEKIRESNAKFLINNKINIDDFAFWQKSALIIPSYNFDYSGAVHDIGEKITFIVGMPRSGKSSLEKLISTTGDFDCYDELFDLSNFLERLTGPDGKEYAYPDYLPFLEDSIFHDMAIDFEQLYNKQVGSSQKLHTLTIPINFFYIPIIHKMLPKAKIVICNRDRPKLLCSLFAKRIVAQTWDWTNDIDLLIEGYDCFEVIKNIYLEKIPHKIFSINFDDLIYKPEKVLKTFFSFVETDKSDDEITKIIKRNKRYIDAIKFEDSRIEKCLPYFPEFYS